MAPRIEVASASDYSLDALTSAFNHAFTGYYLPMTQTPASLAEMMHENEVRVDASRVLLLDGAVEGVGLVGMRDDRAWVGGMGIGPRWRGQGYGRLLLDHLLDAMHGARVRLAQLEVLTINTPALALYERAGFRDVRELRVYQGALRPTSAEESTDSIGAGARYGIVSPAFALPALETERTVAPAWQREPRTLERVRVPLSGLGFWEGPRLRAYILYGQRQGGIVIYDALSAAVETDSARADITALLRRLVADQPETLVRAINTPASDPLGAALDWLGCTVVMRQREMARTL